MTIDCVYYTPELRCYRNGVVERLFKKKVGKKWKILLIVVMDIMKLV